MLTVAPAYLYEVDPEWVGRLGEQTVYSTLDEHPQGFAYRSEVSQPEWLAEPGSRPSLMRCGSVYIVDGELAGQLTAAGMSGMALTPLSGPAAEGCVRLTPEGLVRCDTLGIVREWSGHDICWGERTGWRGPTVVPDNPRAWATLDDPYGLFVSPRCLYLLVSHRLGLFQARSRMCELNAV